MNEEYRKSGGVGNAQDACLNLVHVSAMLRHRRHRLAWVARRLDQAVPVVAAVLITTAFGSCVLQLLG